MKVYSKLKKTVKNNTFFCLTLGLLVLITSCKNKLKSTDLAIKTTIKEGKVSPKKNQITPEFKTYWYDGKAEISSYKLEQARYGEIREGRSVLIYVTEDFLPEIQVKADYQNPKNIPILKLNSTKKFITGIYPYSIMQSTFYPVSNDKNALKISSSIQEWCGNMYTQLNSKDQFEISSHSYFENEADEHFKLDRTILENELWTKLRINPKLLPIGNLNMIPALEYTSLNHKKIRAYQASAILNDGVYTIKYPELQRTLVINFNTSFPYDILSWKESTGNQVTKAIKLKTIKSSYWNKKKNKDLILRDTLLLN